jgi:hypothetical protein
MRLPNSVFNVRRWNPADIVFIIFIGYFLSYTLPTLDAPWRFGHTDAIGSRLSIIAMNHLRLGLAETKFGMMENTNSFIHTGAEEFGYYTHHPIGVPLAVALSFVFLGVNEWVARLVPVSLNILTLTLMYLICCRSFNRLVGLLAVGYTVTTPLFYYIRDFVAFDPPVATFTLLVTFLYMRWLRSPSNKGFIAIALAFLVGTLSEWSFYFVIPALVGHHIFFVEKQVPEEGVFALTFGFCRGRFVLPPRVGAHRRRLRKRPGWTD